MLGKHKFKVGQRVRPSPEGIAANLFTKARHDQSGVVVKVDELNSPSVKWDWRKTATHYWPGFIEPDYRKHLDKQP